MSRKKRTTASTRPTNLTAFRQAERRWKDRARPVDLSLAFDPERLIWDAEPVEGRLRGVCSLEPGAEEVCWRVGLDELAPTGMGQSRWKGKEREEEGDYAIVIPRVPGLVFFPRILPEALQRELVVETLQHARRPNLTQLDKLYELPKEGLWAAWLAGKGSQVVPRTEEAAPGSSSCTQPGIEKALEGAASSSAACGAETPQDIERNVTIEELLPKLRWANVGWHYNWTTKLYEFERGHVPLPPLILRYCRTLGRVMPWQHVFGASDAPPDQAAGSPQQDWRKWRDVYEPDAGIVNFYQVKDSLTSHVDQAEEDAVLPLVSLSIGHASVFLVGGTDRDVPPLAIVLRSGDALLMSGEGRRVFHDGTLPDHLKAAQPDGVDGIDDWSPYGAYLERGARINVNVRSVF
ncbi:hypothetical protein Rhopal_000156-T1 [Rhodotorula paludigena]|uniref:Alpha-ketoglutarate-dependent dioxygenase AlkB-like domain-containing protein n=1 Tax=Rhodotorula paludigena TaxID=86838 RepID=A0AAV5G460_9BASI|nr:hypothetical protein Rhopal_000156-T1 [Rhodotorula paludigena]